MPQINLALCTAILPRTLLVATRSHELPSLGSPGFEWLDCFQEQARLRAFCQELLASIGAPTEKLACLEHVSWGFYSCSDVSLETDMSLFMVVSSNFHRFSCDIPNAARDSGSNAGCHLPLFAGTCFYMPDLRSIQELWARCHFPQDVAS